MKYKIRYNSELYHHGINGMKWGIRRYQNPDGSLTPEGRVHYGYNSETRHYTKELNRIDKSTVDDKRKLLESQEKESKITKKMYKIVSKNTKNGVATLSGKNFDEVAKLAIQSEAQRKESEIYRTRINEANDRAKSIIAEAESKGYKVDSKDVIRVSVTGADIAKSLLATTAVGIGANIAGLPVTALFLPGKTVEGKKYKVRETREG